MTRIKIGDIPEDKKLSPEELRTIMGGGINPSGIFEAGQTSFSNPPIRTPIINKWAQPVYIPSQTDPSKLMK